VTDQPEAIRFQKDNLRLNVEPLRWPEIAFWKVSTRSTLIQVLFCRKQSHYRVITNLKP